MKLCPSCLRDLSESEIARCQCRVCGYAWKDVPDKTSSENDVGAEEVHYEIVGGDSPSSESEPEINADDVFANFQKEEEK